MRTRAGKEFVQLAEQPMGGAGRPLDETRALVRQKFIRQATPSIGKGRAEEAAAMIERLNEIGNLQELTELLRT